MTIGATGAAVAGRRTIARSAGHRNRWNNQFIGHSIQYTFLDLRRGKDLIKTIKQPGIVSTIVTRLRSPRGIFVSLIAVAGDVARRVNLVPLIVVVTVERVGLGSVLRLVTGVDVDRSRDLRVREMCVCSTVKLCVLPL